MNHSVLSELQLRLDLRGRRRALAVERHRKCHRAADADVGCRVSVRLIRMGGDAATRRQHVARGGQPFGKRGPHRAQRRFILEHLDFVRWLRSVVVVHLRSRREVYGPVQRLAQLGLSFRGQTTELSGRPEILPLRVHLSENEGVGHICGDRTA